MLRQHRTKNFKGITWKSGHIYKFRYQAWNNDPEPVIILLNSYSGTHPTSGNQWRFFQGINFTYIPRPQRRHFAERWSQEWEQTNGNVEMTWQRVVQQFPYLKGAIRRYFYQPSYYISKAIEVPMEDMEQVIVSTWNKDFSKKLRTNLMDKFRRTKNNVKRGKDTGFFGR